MHACMRRKAISLTQDYYFLNLLIKIWRCPYRLHIRNLENVLADHPKLSTVKLGIYLSIYPKPKKTKRRCLRIKEGQNKKKNLEMCVRERVIKIDLQNALIDPMKSVKGLFKTDDFYCSYLACLSYDCALSLPSFRHLEARLPLFLFSNHHSFSFSFFIFFLI
jgi:hypothetical protein